MKMNAVIIRIIDHFESASVSPFVYTCLHARVQFWCKCIHILACIYKRFSVHTVRMRVYACVIQRSIALMPARDIEGEERDVYMVSGFTACVTMRDVRVLYAPQKGILDAHPLRHGYRFEAGLPLYQILKVEAVHIVCSILGCDTLQHQHRAQTVHIKREWKWQCVRVGVELEWVSIRAGAGEE